MIEAPKFSVAELYDPAMKISDPDEARDYVESLTRYISEEEGLSEEEAREVAIENIGYYAGLIDEETRERVEKVYGAYHPNLGTTQPNSSDVPPHYANGILDLIVTTLPTDLSNLERENLAQKIVLDLLEPKMFFKLIDFLEAYTKDASIMRKEDEGDSELLDYKRNLLSLHGALIVASHARKLREPSASETL